MCKAYKAFGSCRLDLACLSVRCTAVLSDLLCMLGVKPSSCVYITRGEEKDYARQLLFFSA